jgi:hypothetical protein
MYRITNQTSNDWHFPVLGTEKIEKPVKKVETIENPETGDLERHILDDVEIVEVKKATENIHVPARIRSRSLDEFSVDVTNKTMDKLKKVDKFTNKIGREITVTKLED